MKQKSAAIITILDGDRMTPKGRRRIAVWLRQQAKFLEQYGKEFSGRFRARYLYR